MQFPLVLLSRGPQSSQVEHQSSNSSCQDWWRQPVWPEKKPALLPNLETRWFISPRLPEPPAAAGFVCLEGRMLLSRGSWVDYFSAKQLNLVFLIISRKKKKHIIFPHIRPWLINFQEFHMAHVPKDVGYWLFVGCGALMGDSKVKLQKHTFEPSWVHYQLIALETLSL